MNCGKHSLHDCYFWEIRSPHAGSAMCRCMAEVEFPCWAACHCGCAWIPSCLSCFLSFSSLSMPHPSHTYGVHPGWAWAFKYRWQFLQLYPGCRRTGCSHLNLNLLTKELTHHFFSFTSQIPAVSVALFQFCALCYLDAVFLSWCWKPDKCLWCKGLAASLLLLPISVKPLWAVVAKLLECNTWSCALPTPGPVRFWSHCQAAATAVRAWIFLPLLHPQKGRYLAQSATLKTLLSWTSCVFYQKWMRLLRNRKTIVLTTWPC